MNKLKIIILIATAIIIKSSCAQHSWVLNPADFEFTHSIIGKVYIDTEVISGEDYQIGAFVNEECRGISSSSESDEGIYDIFYLTIHSNQSGVENLSFIVRNADNEEFTIVNTVLFIADGITGNHDEPFLWMDNLIYNSTDFLSYSLSVQSSESEINNVNNTINLLVPEGTNLTSLIPEFTIAPGALVKINGIVQESEISSVNFSYDIIYEVTGADGSIAQWTVSVDYDNSSVNYFLSNSITVYPNPVTSGIVTVKNDNLLIYDIKIYDIMGSLIKHKTLEQAQTTTNINLSDLRAGVYHLYINTIDNISLQKKLIVE